MHAFCYSIHDMNCRQMHVDALYGFFDYVSSTIGIVNYKP